MFYTRMWYRKLRLLLVGFGILGFGSGAALATVDPSNSIGLALFAGVVVSAAGITYWYSQRLKHTGQLDERTEQIQLRANRASYNTLVVAITAVLPVYLFTELTPNVIIVLAALLLGGGLINELYIEWYRHKL